MNTIIPIKPVYVDQIFFGLKEFELRRKPPKKLKIDDFVYIYECARAKALVGVLLVTRIEVSDVEDLWERVGGKSGLHKVQFFQYFAGITDCTAINFRLYCKYKNPIKLLDLGITAKGIQNFMYVKSKLIKQQLSEYENIEINQQGQLFL